MADALHKGKPSKISHNTGLLLHALGDGLRIHLEQSVVTAEDLNALEIMALVQDLDPDVQLAAIKRTKTRTALLLSHAERLFAAWEKSSQSGHHRFRRKVVHERYFGKLEISQIAQKLNKDETIVLSQLGVALDQLSTYFFGENGLPSARVMPIPKGVSIELSIKELPDGHEAAFKEWLNRGELRSIGHWRNSGKSRFVWEES